jgi:cytochrome c-type biogenesis protein CcmH
MMAELPEGSQVKAAVADKIAMLDAPEPAEPQAAAPQQAQAPAAAQPDAQQQMINSMVARLAERLATKGGDAEEWMRLIRAYKVLNESDKAEGALADARKALANDASSQDKLAALALEMGLRGK